MDSNERTWEENHRERSRDVDRMQRMRRKTDEQDVPNLKEQTDGSKMEIVLAQDYRDSKVVLNGQPFDVMEMEITQNPEDGLTINMIVPGQSSIAPIRLTGKFTLEGVEVLDV